MTRKRAYVGGDEILSIQFILSLKMLFPLLLIGILFNNVNIFHRIRYCVISCPRAIFNSVIQSVNTVIVLLFCLLPVINIIYRYWALLFGYLPVLSYLPVLCSSAIPLSTCACPSAVVCWSCLLLYFIGTNSYSKLLLKTDNVLINSIVHNVCIMYYC